MYDSHAIISLTTWPARIKSVGLTIFGLLAACPGFHIVLCLSAEEFPRKEADLPPDLNTMYKCGLFEILWCDINLRPHNKYFFTMLRYRDIPIITVDDDQIPITNVAELLYNSYRNDPYVIHAGRCHEIKYNHTTNRALPYDQWVYEQQSIRTPSKHLFATGVGGVLYPPNILQLGTKCITKILDIITADDIYLKVRENELNLKVKYVPGCAFIDTHAKHGLATAYNNTGKCLNNKYIKKYL